MCALALKEHVYSVSHTVILQEIRIIFNYNFMSARNNEVIIITINEQFRDFA